MEFLKDETGNRRFWVVPIKSLNFKMLEEVDVDQLWGEVMDLYLNNVETHYLDKNELEILNKSNQEFTVLNQVDIAVSNNFAWKMDKVHWKWKPSTEIAGKLNLKSTKGLREAIENMGGAYKRVDSVRGYVTPPYAEIQFDFKAI